MDLMYRHHCKDAYLGIIIGHFTGSVTPVFLFFCIGFEHTAVGGGLQGDGGQTHPKKLFSTMQRETKPSR